MFYYPENQRLAIFVAERLEAEPNNPNDTWYHSFLLLVDKTKDPVTILQQLHFKDEAPESQVSVPKILEPLALRGISDPMKYPERFKGIKISPIAEGSTDEILGKWNDILAYAFYLKTEEIPFSVEGYKHDPESVNCRFGIVAVLAAIGIEFSPNHYAAEAGTRSPRLSALSKAFNFNSINPLARKSEVNERRMNALGADRHTDRYIGSVPHPFLPMS